MRKQAKFIVMQQILYNNNNNIFFYFKKNNNNVLSHLIRYVSNVTQILKRIK